ncbi:MAG: Crp/Fnr family transcriptional regulator [Bacteroidales bacterium]|nr:Crp/Fnr family transcriptional regulator [Bacteroidales bacterium]
MNLTKWSIDKYNLTEEEMKLTLGSYVPKTIKANDFFLKEGEICNYIGYVTKGLLRSYFYDDQANEITTSFFPESTLIIALDSFNNRAPSKEFIKAIEDSELSVVSYLRQMELYQLIPAWNQICKDLGDIKIGEMLNRTENFQTLTAAERYQRFCKEYPQLLQRVNLGYIASYIGVDNATLSRIRKKK